MPGIRNAERTNKPLIAGCSAVSAEAVVAAEQLHLPEQAFSAVNSISQ